MKEQEIAPSLPDLPLVKMSAPAQRNDFTTGTLKVSLFDI